MRRRTNGRGNRAAAGYRSAYNAAREYPGTIAAIVVGIGITGFLLWAARRSGGWENLQSDALERVREGYGRVRQGYDYAREGYDRARDAVADRAARIRGASEDLAEL